ncbi:MAG: bifunctional DNA-formamidopyrimidine glycosylase/DNA-(apurinic or apyrimidinic site) lyase [Deltaproteobacteria bacterium]|nr:bifunctional DNA-formamidopyrimidine glycosylase/DNA-(apurinic or apyrimidinic site) lyase [Deltaproteobacteria bacterium]MBW2448196.1 bifunctional DNA-formamidopyrimidine glycosylase/DNA-(apurinic or apyrimidinic site) lyase [Deltaproteobacteria bacterium]
MPELPEVEVTRRRIAPALVGRTIRSVRTTKPSYFFLTPPATLRRRLAGRTVSGLERHGKYLIAGLDDGARVLLHLGMTGQLFPAGASSLRLLSATARAALAPDAQPEFRPDAHTHLVWSFKDEGPEVFFRDVRKFGKVLWIAPGAECERLARLGRDALEMTGPELFDATRKRTVAIKSLLMAQSVVAGVGNIYADEALFLAGVRPTRRAAKVTRAECDRLAREIRRVMLRSIETGGSSISDYVAPDGSDGAYQDERRVYARAGEPCLVCETPVKKIVLGARGTHYCPRCQA